jgi:polyhydroxybutyrate depolymerase
MDGVMDALPRSVERRLLETPEGKRRRFLLHVPPTVRPDEPAPLVIEFHGSGSVPAEQMRYSGLHRLADAHGFVVAAPQAAIPLRMFNNSPGGMAWNIPGVPLVDGGMSSAAPDDVAFVRQMVDAVAEERAIDRRRVYGVGFSGGGRFCCHLARAVPGLLAAMGTVAGLRLLPGARPSVPVIAFHGTDDPLNPYLGGAGERWDLSVPETADLFGAALGCVPGEEVSVSDAVSHRPYRTAGGDVAVAQYTVRGGGHNWPGTAWPQFTEGLGPATQEIDASALIWEFFAPRRLGDALTAPGA